MSAASKVSEVLVATATFGPRTVPRTARFSNQSPPLAPRLAWFDLQLHAMRCSQVALGGGSDANTVPR